MYAVLGVAAVVGFVYVLGKFLIADEDDLPSGFHNPWLELDIENLEYIKLVKDGNNFKIEGKSKSNHKTPVYVVQLTESREGEFLFLLMEEADSPPASKFLYRHTDNDGRFEFEVHASQDINRVFLKRSKHVLWTRDKA